MKTFLTIFSIAFTSPATHASDCKEVLIKIANQRFEQCEEIVDNQRGTDDFSVGVSESLTSVVNGAAQTAFYYNLHIDRQTFATFSSGFDGRTAGSQTGEATRNKCTANRIDFVIRSRNSAKGFVEVAADGQGVKFGYRETGFDSTDISGFCKVRKTRAQ